MKNAHLYGKKIREYNLASKSSNLSLDEKRAKALMKRAQHERASALYHARRMQ